VPVINLTTLQDVLGGTEPVDAIVTAVIYRGEKQAIRIEDDEVIFPEPVRVKIVNGEPVEPFILLPLDADCHYKLDVFVDGTYPYRASVILPAGDGPFDISELVVVNPSTALPDAGTSLADAFLAQVEALRDGMIVNGQVVGDDLILTQVDGDTINAGNVRGPQGPQGETGPQGADGFIGVDGQSAYEVAVENGFVGTEEEWLEYLRQGPKGDKGDKGDTGEQGPQGEQGTQGIQGIQGVKGDKGDKGDDGVAIDFIQNTAPTGTGTSSIPAGALWFHTDTGVQYTYFNDGNTYQWVQETLPLGPQGPQGANGTNAVNNLTSTTFNGLLKGNGATISATDVLTGC
jgi:hypothetical protein